MDIHKNAKLTPQSRAAIVRRVLDQGQHPPRWPSTSGSVPARCVSGWSAIKPRVRTDCATAARGHTASATAFLAAALAYYQHLGIQVRRVLTYNGGCYRSRAFNARCLTDGLRHRYTCPFTPRTNGKAERFIQTALREWAYAHVYHTSAERAAHLPPWIHRYIWHRPHASLKARPPISRIGLTGDKLLRFHS